MTRPRWRIPIVLLCAALLAAGCGSSRDDNKSSSGDSGDNSGSSSASGIDASKCTNTTEGVSSNEIKIGMSHPESGLAAPYSVIADGVKGYFGYINAQGGVKGHKLTLITKDDAYDSGKTVDAVNQLTQQEKVFAFLNNLGTAPNLAVREQLDAGCIPNLQTATGAQSLNDPKFPFTLLGNPAYATESAIFAKYLKDNMPQAKVAVLYQNDDYGQSYLGPLQKAIEGSDIKIVAKQSYEVTDATLDSQMTTLAASGADALFLGTDGLDCPKGIDSSGGKGFKFIYLSGTCTSSVLMGLAKPANSNGIYSTLYIKDPQDPQWANDEAMKLFKDNVKKYESKADPTNGLVAYGWTQAAIFVELLKKAEKLDRVSVMETARDTKLDNPPGLLLPKIPWATGKDDGFPLETFYLGKYDSGAKIFKTQGDVIDEEGKTTDVL